MTGWAPSSSSPSTAAGTTGVGIDLVAMCANDLIVQGAEPLFFLDYFATGKLESGIAERVIASIARRLPHRRLRADRRRDSRDAGHVCAGDYDLAGFCVGAVERGEALTGAAVAKAM
jgi:phosphoribosylaminoimidazole (AIR) synthetase